MSVINEAMDKCSQNPHQAIGYLANQVVTLQAQLDRALQLLSPPNPASGHPAQDNPTHHEPSSASVPAPREQNINTCESAVQCNGTAGGEIDHKSLLE
jgi:hypothetical protein